MSRHSTFSVPPGAFVILAVAAACLLLPGCGPPRIKPWGRIMKDGQPYPLEKGFRFQVAFIPIDPGEGDSPDPYGASIGFGSVSFRVDGRRDGKGIPPGKYRVTVAHLRNTGEADLWGGKYGPDKSPFVFDLQDDDEELIIDLAKAE